MSNPQGIAGQSQETGEFARDTVASIEEIMVRANRITKFPEFQAAPAGDAPSQDSPVRAYCISRLKSNWTSKISPFSRILKEYLGILESNKRFSKEQLLGPQLNSSRTA